MINYNNFALRLSQLREEKDVSARDMSIKLGQNPAYINNIETNKALPSMSMFFNICDYLEITPSDFFNDDIENPSTFNKLCKQLATLSSNQLNLLTSFISSFSNQTQKNAI